MSMLEKRSRKKTCVERDCALATIAEPRQEQIRALEKQLAGARGLSGALGLLHLGRR